MSKREGKDGCLPLRQPRASALNTGAAFQPVPGTSPVPSFYTSRAPAQQALASGLDTSVEHTEFFVFYSHALDRPMHYLVYEPRAYFDNPERRYPVLYMLHGGGGSKDEWPAYGLVDDVCTEPLPIVRGKIAVLSAPGLGIERDPEKLRRYAVRE